MIRPGSTNEVTLKSGKWVFIDIGFANKAKSCGVLFDDGSPEELTFSQAVKKICKFVKANDTPVNLVIEAPLSVAFDSNGNPKGRRIEKQNKKTRYWYVSLGTTVMVGAMYLIKAIIDFEPTAEIRLFEGFVSFKDSNTRTNHSRDVLMLRDIVIKEDREAIISPESLKMDDSDLLKSAFWVAGVDLGVPPVLIKNG